LFGGKSLGNYCSNKARFYGRKLERPERLDFRLFTPMGGDPSSASVIHFVSFARRGPFLFFVSRQMS
jgi:hypothetical protein